MRLALSFTNFGPYHLARLRALAMALSRVGDDLVAYETAGVENLYPWRTTRRAEPFRSVTLFPARVLEELRSSECVEAIEQQLEHDQPDVVAVAGYVRPECLAALRWGRRRGRPVILMSESQAIDKPRVWWKEQFKRERVRRFSAALVGGPSHKAYLEALGVPDDRIALGYNAVDNNLYAARAQAARRAGDPHGQLPRRPYFLSVSRFASEKNLPRLIQAYGAYRRQVADDAAWDLVLCGSGPDAAEVEAAITQSGYPEAIHRPGFLQANDLVFWYAHASAFVLPSRSEPWGLVVNEAAACGVPLLVSNRAGASGTLVPEPPGTTGMRFDPLQESDIIDALHWMATRSSLERQEMGQRAAALVADWGPERFASGMLEATSHALRSASARPSRVVALPGR